jgi:hypothetical protein
MLNETTGTETTETVEVKPDGVSSVDSSIDSSTPATETADKPVVIPAKSEELFDWMKDKRFEKSWKKNPNELYRSYREIERVYNPLKKQFDALASVFKEIGIEANPETIRAIAKEFNSLKDPKRPENQVYSYLNELADDDLSKEELQKALDKIQEEKLNRKYPGMTADQRQKQIEIEKKLHHYDNVFKEQQTAKEVESHKSAIRTGIDKARKLAESRGFNLSNEVINSLLDHCVKNNIAPQYVYHTFYDLYKDQLDKSYAEKIEKDVVGKLNKNKQAGIVSASTSGKEKAGAPADSKGAFRSNISKALDKMGIT